MAPPSQLNIATSSINRLLKEESSYRTELSNQEKRVEKLKGGGGDSEEAGNREFQLRQEERGIHETNAVFAPLKEKIAVAVARVQGMLESGEEFQEREIEEARDAVARARDG